MKKLFLIISVMLIFSQLLGFDIKDDNYMKHFLGSVAISEATWQVSSLFLDRTELREWWDETGYHCRTIRVENQWHFPYKMLMSMGMMTAVSYATKQEDEDLLTMTDGFKVWFIYKLFEFQIQRGKW